MRRIPRLWVALAAASLGGCGDEDASKSGAAGPGGQPLSGMTSSAMPPSGKTSDAHPAAPEQKPQRFDGIGSFHRTVTTTSPNAQRWFDQGLTLLYAFNHDESIRSFQEAARVDPECAMAWWGVALANGPHLNNPALAPDRATAAFQAIGRAKAASGSATAVEKALIDALSRRYAADPKAERGPLDTSYADAMRSRWQEFGTDADVGTLFAESMMDLRPWDLWKRDGTAQPGTDELVATLEAVLANAPDHPGANHFYVHATEASPHPEKALPSADRLRTLVPMSGHLVHMPAHTYQRVGRYEDAAEANRRAIAAEDAYLAKSPQQDFYMMYVAHNHQFLAFAASMEGKSAEAIQAARNMAALVPPERVEQMADMVDGVIELPILVLARFGRWDEVAKEPKPSKKLPLATGIWHYARGLAFSAQGKFGDASREMTDLAKASAEIGERAKFGLNLGRPVLALAHKVLAGEIAQRTGQLEQAVALLGSAVEAEDALRYDEPPDWFEPVRHRFGALLLAVGKPKEAEAAYREDLQRNPENGWALVGLWKALEAQQKSDEAAVVKTRFEAAWGRADVKLTSSRF